MAFVVKIDKNILRQIERLPLKLQTEFLLNALIISKSGLSIFPPHYLKLGTRDSFALFIPTPEDNFRHQNGLVLKGHLRRNKNPEKEHKAAIYIRGYHKLNNGKVNGRLGSNGALEAERVIDRKKLSGYLTLDYDELERKYASPRIKALAEKRSVVLKSIARSRNSMIDTLFYKDLREVMAYGAHIRKFQSDAPFQYLVPNDRCDYCRLDSPTDSVTGKEVTIYDVLQARKTGDIIFLVNFVDELDAFTHAQKSFTAMLAEGIQQIIPYSEVAVVDVIIRDKFGKKPFWGEFLKYTERAEWVGFSRKDSNTPSPFSMIMGRLRGTHAISKLLDFDLFRGCRDLSTLDQSNLLYKQNLSRIIHQAFGVVGFTTDVFSVLTKDFTLFDQSEVLTRIEELSQQTVTVIFNAEDDEAYQRALQASIHLVSEGYPYIAMAKTHIDKGKISLVCNGQETPVQFDDLEVEMLRLYQRHILDHAATETKITLDVFRYASLH